MFQGINTILDGIRNAIRSGFQRSISSLSVPPLSFAQVRTQTQNYTVWNLYMDKYLVQKPYLNTTIASLPANASPPSQEDVNFAAAIGLISISWQPNDIVNQTYEEVDAILMRNITSIDDCSATVRQLKECVDNHAQKVYQWYWNNLTSDADRRDLITAMSSRDDTSLVKNIYANIFPQTQINPNPPRTNNISDAYQKLGRTFLTTSLDASALRFCVNPGPGSCGMYYHEELAYLFMIPLFPEANEKEIPAQLLRIRPGIFDDDGISGDVNDEYQVHLEERFKRMFTTDSIPYAFRESTFRSVAPTPRQSQAPTPGDTNRRGPSTSSNRGRSRRRNTTSSSTGPSPPTNNSSSVPPTPPTQPTIPDDDDYEPDPVLASKASRITAYVKSELANGNRIHDHMDRFGTTSESATVISRLQIRRGDNNDDTIMIRTYSGTKQYVVTYTRKSQKPIFNLVS